MDFFSYLREFNMPSVLLRLTLAVVFGGIIGRKLNRQMANQSVERLFIGLIGVIICISLFNTWRYAGW